VIYYARVVGTVEYCITPGRAELESVRNRNWRVRAEVLDLVRGPSIRLLVDAESASRFLMNASVDASVDFTLSLSLSFRYGNGVNSAPTDFLYAVESEI